MKELSKKILSTLTAAAMIFTIFASPVGEIFGFVGETVKASAYSIAPLSTEIITDKSSSEVARALERISRQNGVSSCKQSGKSVRDMIEYFLFTSKYRVFGGEYFPKAYCNDASSSADTITDGTYTESGIGSRGCLAYAKWVARTINTIKKSDGTDSIAISNLTASTIKENIKKYAQAGETIQVAKQDQCPHTIVFISADEEGFYYFDFSGWSESYGELNTRNFCYTTYEKFATSASKRGTGIWIGKYIDEQNNDDVLGENLDLTSAPNNLGTQFVAPIKVTSTGKVLTAGADGNVTVQTWTGADNQRWIFTKNSSDNYYEIRNGQYYQKVLDVSNGSDKDGANLQIWEDNDTASQRFGIYGSQGNYIIKVKYSSGRVIDSDGGNSNVHMWTYYKDIAAQKFTISPEPTTRFDTFSATNITNNDARVKCKAYKRSEDKAVKYGVVYAPADTWNVTSTRKSFYSTASTTNVGSTYREIYFDFGSEIGDTLKPDTTYNYYFVAVYSMDGVNMTFSSSVQSFKTTNTCTHTFGSWTTKTAATCTADGLKQRTCSKCGKVESATITKLGHSYTSSVTKAATCTATGVKTYKCSRCTSSYTESIAKTGHSYGNHHEEVHPHKIYKKCTVCSAIEYTGGTQYICSCLSCTNLVAPTITVTTSQPNINKAVTFSWVASPKDKLAGYWVQIAGPDGNMFKTISISKDVNSYTFTPTMPGEYKIAIAATPTGSTEGAGCVWANKTVKVHDYITYTIKSTYTSKGFDHHLCSQCTAEYMDNYTSGTKSIPSTSFTATAKGKSVTLTIATMPYVEGYKIIRKYNGVVDKEFTVDDPAHYTFDITDFNTGRGANELIIYTRSGRYAETNIYGSEIVVDANGYVIGERAYGSEVKSVVPEGGFVASMHNPSSQFADIAIGDRVVYDMPDKTLTVYYAAKTAKNITYTDTTAEYGKSYTYTVIPYAEGYNGATSEKSVTTAPSAISGFSVTSKTANTITLGWTKNATATGYIIQQMKNGSWTNIANISNNATTTYTVSGLAASTSYSFRAVAYATANGSNIYSGYTASTPAITLPASITGFAITGRDSSSLTLSWAKNTSADGYVIQQQVNGAWSNIAVLKSNATVTYKVTELDPNAFYRFRMVAFKSHDGTKLYSKYTGAMSGYTAPAMVSGLKVVTDSENQLTVSWSKVDSANGYVLDIYKDGKWTEVARYKSNATLKYVATGLTAGTQYKFRIKSYAVNNSLTIYSTYSSPVIAVTKPAQVTGFKITANGSNSVSLSWNKMNVSGYVIQCLKNNEWVTVGNIKDGTVTSYTVTGLTANSSYKFRMVAYATVNNTSVYGKYTAALAGRTAPAKVTNLTMTNRGTDFISVRWDKNEKADGYMIYLYDGTKWTCVKTMTSNSAVSHKITGLTSGKAYKITVKAFKTVDNVKYVSDSVTISATTL